MRYKNGDTVLYGAHGVCEIAETTQKCVDGKNVDYYVLKPVFDGNSTIFVPVDNAVATAKMRRVLTNEEVSDLIKTIPGEDTIWIENENARKEQYKKILAKGDRSELIRLIKTLYMHDKKRKESGKKIHAIDARLLKDAEKMLHEEFAHVLNIDPCQVEEYISNAIFEMV